LQGRIDDSQMDYEDGIMLLNLIADFWDIKEQYDILFPNGRIEKRSTFHQTSKSVTPKRPSCSVLIKYLEKSNDILFAHNTWHEYRAMGYRCSLNSKYLDTYML